MKQALIFLLVFAKIKLNFVKNTSGRITGSYGVTVELVNSNYAWSDGSPSPLTYTYTINKIVVTIPTPDTTAIPYDGTEHTFSVAASDYYTSTPVTGTNAGTYTVTASLNDTTNYIWSDVTTAQKSFTFTISKASLTKPTAVDKTYTYNGNEQEFAIDNFNGELMSITGHIQTDAGTHTVTVSLKYTVNYQWADGTTDPLTFNFVITNKTSLEMPSLLLNNVVYNPATSYGVNNLITANDAYTVAITDVNGTAMDSVTNAGTYTVKVTLNNTTTHQWADGTTDPLTFSFVINKAVLNLPTAVVGLVYNGTSFYDAGGSPSKIFNDFDSATMTVDSQFSYQPFGGNWATASSVLNAGMYKINVYVANNNYVFSGSITSATIEITVAKLQVQLTGDYGKNYDATGITKAELLGTKDNHPLYDFVNGELALTTWPSTHFLAVTDLNDGAKNYTYPVKVGNTYVATLSIADTTNFELVGDGEFLVKYKTAMVGSTYYTIEDALAANGSITLVGDSTNANTYVITSFTSLSADRTGYNTTAYYTLASGETLLLPFDSSDKSGYAAEKGTPPSKHVYSALELPLGKTFIINGTLNVGGKIYTKSGSANQVVTSERSVFMNKGIVELNGTINCYGYIKGVETKDANNNYLGGLINAYSSAVINDVMRIYDWKGGSVSYALNKYSIFPFTAYQVHNNACTTKIVRGATLTAKIYIDMTTTVDKTVTIVANTGAMFTISNTNSYIIKRVTPANNADKGLYEITGENQIKGQRDVVETYGDVTDNSVKIDLGMGQSITTSKTYPLPFGFMDIHIKSGTTTLNSVSYKFMPGSQLVIDSGATLKLSNGASISIYKLQDRIYEEGLWSGNAQPFTSSTGGHCVNRTDAILLVNGTLTVESGSSIGGFISTNSSGAIFNFNGGNLVTHTVPTATSGSSIFANAETTPNPNYAKGNILGSGESAQFTSGNTYYSTGNAWYVPYKVTYNSNGGTSSTASQTYNATALTLPSATRTGYTFNGWYTAASGGEMVGNAGESYTPTAHITLYAQWTAKTYTVTLNTTGGTLPSGISSEFSVIFDSKYPALPTEENMIRENYKFIGWYTEASGGTKITGDATTVSTANNHTLYAQWAELSQITVTYDYGYNEKVGTANCQSGDSIELPNDTRVGYTFNGWYTAASGGTKIGDGGTSYDPTEDVTLYAQWTAIMYTVTYNYGNGSGSPSSDNGSIESSVTLPAATRTGYTFNGWYTAASGGSRIGAAGDPYKPEADITLYAQWTIKSYGLTNNASSCISSIKVNGTEWNGSDNIPHFATLSITTIAGKGIKVTIDGNTYDAQGERRSAVTKDYTVDGEIKIEESTECIVEGTLITLADGSKKKIEDLTHNDRILVFNHETGKLDVSTMMFNVHTEQGAEKVTVTNMYFSNGAMLRIVSEHGFFDIDANKYVYITEENIESYLGHKFYSTNYVEGKFVSEIVTLNRYELTEETVRYYSPMSAYAINLFTEGVLSSTAEYDELINVFELDENMMIDQAKKQADIDKYGLCDYETSIWKDYVSYEVFLAFNGQYVNVAIGKGLVTQEYVIYLIETYDIGNTVILPNETTTTQ